MVIVWRRGAAGFGHPLAARRVKVELAVGGELSRPRQQNPASSTTGLLTTNRLQAGTCADWPCDYAVW